MNTQNESKLKKMLELHKPGTVVLAKWLENVGISRELQKNYKKSGWLEKLRPGAYKRPTDQVTWQGGLYAIQQQTKLQIHAGALTALSLQGQSHYFRISGEKIFLFSAHKTILPQWFKAHEWGQKVQHIKTSLLPDGLGLTQHEEKNFSITISAPERAILECLYLAPDKLDLMECYHLVEGLSNLRPKLLQDLLEKCSSVKVKRLFLLMASKAQHQWLAFLDLKKIDLGKGDRSIIKGGVYNAQFHVSVPKELVNNP
ncbi:MAG: type IV toxin-antitoxin system AbiEi family antitoxin [Cytophagales bacterium]|nr:type IV toxin-antitoxin system AbiEi family antitoxin [Cytophagales bacterium]